ncbi:MAG: hypothetical protein CL610_01540 [Anaerolineaceae bacterium]|nr:hypothetical protein [Anaerolineaceae bacterium]
MKWFWILAALVGLLATACQPADQAPQELPTLAVLPSLTVPVAEATDTDAPTALPATDTPASTVVSTRAATPTVEIAEPTETAIPSPTRPPVTIEIREEIRFATLTPVPAGQNAPARTTPMVMADAVITEPEFQAALNDVLADVDSIQLATIDFVPEGIDVELTALGGAAYMSGNVQVLIDVVGSFASISIGDVTVNAAEPPDAYLETVNGDFFAALIEAFDALLTERVGEGHDLENILLNDEAMQVFLLVPQS